MLFQYANIPRYAFSAACKYVYVVIFFVLSVLTERPLSDNDISHDMNTALIWKCYCCTERHSSPVKSDCVSRTRSGNSSCRSSLFFSFTLQQFAADNNKAGAASTAADK